MFFLPFSAKHALYQLRDVTQYILALGGLAVSNPGYVVYIIYAAADDPSPHNTIYSAPFVNLATPMFYLLKNFENQIKLI